MQRGTARRFTTRHTCNDDVGRLICLADMIEVFALNMTYDVPVKLFSFQMVLMAAFLLIPERQRLFRFCFRNCAVEASSGCRFLAGQRANRIAVAAQIVFGLVLLGTAFHSARQGWFKYGGGAPKFPLYGIWNVDEMSIDGVVRPPLLTDDARWRRATLSSLNGWLFTHRRFVWRIRYIF